MLVNNSLLFFYYLFLIILAIAIASSKQVREFLVKIHASPTDSHSWTRYASTLLLLVTIGILIYQVTNKPNVDLTLITWLLAVSFGGKLLQSTLNKNK